MPRVLAHDAGGVARERLLDLLEPGFDLFLRELHGQRPFGDIEDNHVAIFHCSDWTALDRFRRHVTCHEAMGSSGEAAVGKQRNGVA